MTITRSKRGRGLKVFLWITWAVNLFLIILVSSVILIYWGKSRFSRDSQIYASITFLFFIFPVIVNFLGLRMVREYFPDRELVLWKRRIYSFLCIVQMIVGMVMAAVALNALFSIASFMLRGEIFFRLVLITEEFTLLLASLLNIAAAIVLMRTIWVIRKNARAALLEAFESV
jgi:hypothetical protein